MEQEESTVSVSVVWRGKKLVVDINSGASLKEFGEEVQKLTNVKTDTMKLIVPQPSGKSSRLLEPLSDEHSYLRLEDTAIFKAKSIRMMGVLENEVDEVLKSAKENLRIVGFEEEERRMRQRMSYGPLSSPKLPEGQYIFCGFKTLELPGIELNPPPSEALKRMHMLAADPGIVAIMNKHHWRVGIMTELAPVGYVGISPKCVLGFNKNHGEEISLRLRTDDLKGFRKYESIKKTLLHELAHMVYSEHDANFYALDKQLNQEAIALDWTRSGSHTLSGVWSREHDDIDTMFQSEIILPHRLGGKSSDVSSSARAASVAAAYHRLAEAISVTSEEHEERDPDYSILEIKEKANTMEAGNEIAVVMDNQGEEGFQLDNEPDPDECFQDQTKSEPDPDDSATSEYMKAEPYHHEAVAKVEPDPEDIEMSQALHIITTNEMLEKKGHEEPDPDDHELSQLHGAQFGSSDSQFMQTNKCMEKTMWSSNSPDPDDLEPKINGSGNVHIDRNDHPLTNSFGDQNHQTEVKLRGECNDFEANKSVLAEPDPDDEMEWPLENSSIKVDRADQHDEELHRIQDPVANFCNRLTKVIEMLRAEINPTDAAVVLHTLFKIIRNLLENPSEMKYRRLRKTNPVFQKSIANYKAAMEVLFLIGFSEDVVLDEIGKAETYLVLKRDDPGLLWLAKSSLETCIG